MKKKKYEIEYKNFIFTQKDRKNLIYEQKREKINNRIM